MVLTVKQVAERLNVEPSCVYAVLAARRLRFVRLGSGRGIIRVREEALEQFIRENTVPRRGKTCRKRPAPAPSAFTRLDAAQLREAWSEQGVEMPSPQRHA